MAEFAPGSGIIESAAALIRLGRPLFLFGGIILYGLGAAVAGAQGYPLSLRSYLFGQAAVTAFQLMTHYANDYFDYEADRANLAHALVGRQPRVVPGRAAAGRGAGAALVLARARLLATASGPRAGVGPLVVPVAAGSCGVLAWAYSAPPLRLRASGLGELNVAVVVTGLVPFLGYLLQAPHCAGRLLPSWCRWRCCSSRCCSRSSSPTPPGDAGVGKRTLVVRLGGGRGARLCRSWRPLSARCRCWRGRGSPSGGAGGGAAGAARAVAHAARACAGDHRDPRAGRALTFWSVALLVPTTVAELRAPSVACGSGARLELVAVRRVPPATPTRWPKSDGLRVQQAQRRRGQARPAHQRQQQPGEDAGSR